MTCPIVSIYGGKHAMSDCCVCVVCGTRDNLASYKALTEPSPLMFCPTCLADEQANDVWLIQHGVVVR